MIVELISVGTELLLGNIVNTNAQYLSKRLANLGMDCYYQTVVGDNSERIKSCLDIAFSRSDIVILTGGLGPTKDDLTKEMLMTYFGKKVVLDQKALDMMWERIKHNHPLLTESMKKQAYVPADSIIMYNHNGTAPGVIMENAEGNKTCIMLPGPPKEMQPMFEEYAADYLGKRSDKVFVSYNIKMQDFKTAPVSRVGESPCADRLDKLLDSPNPTVATYAKEDGCLIRVTAAAPTHAAAVELIKPMLEKCKAALGEEYIRYIKEDF